jgi:ribonuclease VapC
MVIDSSAVVAILLDEAEAAVFSRVLAGETKLAMSAVTFHEASLVMAGKKGNPSAARFVDDFVRDLEIEIAAATIEDALAARDAYFRFGRGYHRAGLNLADCFVYALAKSRGVPLLFKGDDFAETDIVPAWRP